MQIELVKKIGNVNDWVNIGKVLLKNQKYFFVVGSMTQCMFVKACIYTAVPQQKWIMLLKIKIYREKWGCLWLKIEN